MLEKENGIMKTKQEAAKKICPVLKTTKCHSWDCMMWREAKQSGEPKGWCGLASKA